MTDWAWCRVLWTGTPVRPEEGRFPHIAWTGMVRNAALTDTMFAGLSDEQCRFYFVHSFTARDVPGEFVTGTASYLGHQVIAAVQRGNVWGTQFHPGEKRPQQARGSHQFYRPVLNAMAAHRS